VNLLERRLLSLVRETHDPFLSWYVVDNLGKGVPVTSKYYEHYQQIRQKIFQEELAVKMQGAKSTSARHADPKEHLKKRHARIALDHAILEARHRMMQQAEYQILLKTQFEHFARDQARMKEMMPGLLREWAHEAPKAVAANFQVADPFLRWVAIQVAAKKWMPVEKELIGLLDDPYPGIRDAARKALVRFSRGNDFGPAAANATASQIEQAQARWQRWLALQFTRQQDETNSYGL
jgi:hypothetical protein